MLNISVLLIQITSKLLSLWACKVDGWKQLPISFFPLPPFTGLHWASLVGSVVKNLPANAGDAGLILGWEDLLEKKIGNPLQYSCLGDSMDRGAWRATVHGVAKELDMT